MKKITLFALFLVMSFSPLLVSADVIPTGMHSVDRCAYITNLSDFPDIYVIESMTGMFVEEGIRNVIVKNNRCLNGDSMYVQSIFFIIDKKYIDSIGTENFIPPKDGITENGITVLKTDFNSYGRYAMDINPLEKEVRNYLLVKDSEGKFFLQKDKIISTYSSDMKDLLPLIFIVVGLFLLITFIIFRIKKIRERKIKVNETLNQ